MAAGQWSALAEAIFAVGPVAEQLRITKLMYHPLDSGRARYGKGLPVAGTYLGRLSNGGERIRVEDALGGEILDFRFEDKWFDVTDGGGYSLEVRDPLNADPTDWSGKGTWCAIPRLGGSPGRD